MFCLSILHFFYIFAFLCFVVLCFVIDPILTINFLYALFVSAVNVLVRLHRFAGSSELSLIAMLV